MAVTSHIYPKMYETVFGADAADKRLDWVGDTIKLALFTSSYTPADTDQYYESISGEVASGGGYTTGGETLTTPTVSFLDDGSATAWAATTAYTVGQIVRPTSANGHLYVCITAGTSGGTEPGTWPTASRDKIASVDGSVYWAEAGRAVVLFDSDLVQWTSSTITARYAVGYKDGTTNNPLLFLIDFGQNESSSSSTFTVTPPTDGWMRFFSAFSY